MVEDNSSVDFEALLISDIVQNKSMRQVLKLKVDETFFNQTLTKSAFLWLKTYFDDPNFGDGPTAETFKHYYPQFALQPVEESTAALVAHVRGDVKYNDLGRILMEIHEAALRDPDAAQALLIERGMYLRLRHDQDDAVTVKGGVGHVRDTYMRMKANPTGLLGWPTRWDAFNKSTLGMQRGHLGVIYARPKRKKTWCALDIMLYMWLYHGIRVAIFSQELPRDEMIGRCVAIVCAVNYSRFLRGRLDPREEFDFLENLAIFDERNDIIIDSLPKDPKRAASELVGKVGDLGIDAFLIDGAHECAEDWRDLKYVTSAWKDRIKKPGEEVFGLLTSHSNKAKGNSKERGDGNDMAYGDGFMTTCDWGVHLSTDVEDLKARQIQGQVAFIRSGTPRKWVIRGRLCENMNQIAEVGFNDGETEEDMEARDESADEIVEAVSKDFGNPESTEEAA